MTQVLTPDLAKPPLADHDLAALTRHGGYLNYHKAANPLASGATPPIPYADFPPELYAEGRSRVIPLDISEKLGCPGPASSPSLCANFIRINGGDRLTTQANASSELFFCIRGRGRSTVGDTVIPFEKGDLFTLPALSRAVHEAETDTAFYWVHDEPLLRYLGVKATERRFEPTLYPQRAAVAALEQARSDPDSAKWSRLSVLYTNDQFPQTLTVTHVLWAMFGILPVGSTQLPHSHKSVAVDFIIDCLPGCYSLVSPEADQNGALIDPVRCDWKPGGVFITPPGYWHEHRNESGRVAYLMPIQDAGLHTYLRTLDIRFHKHNKT